MANALDEVAAKARRRLADELNQAVRRLRDFDNERQWSQTLVDSSEGFCERAALFVVNQQRLELRATRNIAARGLPPIPLASARAFESAVESRDTVVALRSPSELSPVISAAFGPDSAGRCSLFPLIAKDRVAAVLYADSDGAPLESSALELLAAFGSAILGAVDRRAPVLNVVDR